MGSCVGRWTREEGPRVVGGLRADVRQGDAWGKANGLHGQLEGKPKTVLSVGGRKFCGIWAGGIQGRRVYLKRQ